MAVARKQAPSAEDAEMRPGLLAMVLRRWWLIVLCVIIGAASAGAISARQQKQYEATAQLLFRDDTTPDQSLQSVLGIPPATSSLDPAQQEATNVALVSVDTVSNMTARALGRHLTGGQIQSEISVSEIGQSNVVSITAKDASATRAAAIANTFARQFVLFAQHTDKSIIDSGIRSLQTQLQSLAPNVQSGPTGRTLKDQIQQLSEFAQLQVG
ncbi:MAG: hypothetical protein JO372_26020, partial [Solirubrobacterales bacterium]|nr:hypothetical protein [Solirubrobacterales bacterium]